MPPKRRSAGTPGGASTSSASRTQSTLSFNNKSRVTKQANSQPPSETKKPGKRLSDAAKEEIIEQVVEPAVADQTTEIQLPAAEEDREDKIANLEAAAVADEDAVTNESGAISATTKSRRRTKKMKESGYEAKVKEAEKISDAKIRGYWKAEEESRLAPRVHQKDVHLHEKILRHFDLSSEYGPCIGIPRLERWKRSFNLGLGPPLEVLAVLLKEENKASDKGVGGRNCGRLAYIDELAGGKVVLVE